MHNVIRRGRSGRELADRMDAVIVHTRHGAELLGARRAGARDPPRRLRPPHAPARRAPAPARARGRRGAGGAVLRGRASVQGGRHAGRCVPGRRGRGAVDRGAPARRVARGARRSCRSSASSPRYVADAELPAYFRRADLLVLPHREVDVSGVLFAGLAFGKAMVLSDVGGFREVVEEHGAGRLVPPGDAGALREAIAALLADPAERARLEQRARAAAAGPYSWDSIAERTLSRLRRGARDEGRLHGQGQGLVGARARLAGRRAAWTSWPSSRPSRTRAHEQRASTWPRAATASRSSPRRSCTPTRPADVDVVVSFLFWNLIREPLISLGRVGCLNFHPAPLPDFRGVGGYNVAILEGLPEWGVSCHFVDEHFDTGDLVAVERFPIDPDAETALSLDLRARSSWPPCSRACMQRAAGRRAAAARAPGRGPLRLARGVRGAARGAPGRRRAAQAARLLVPALARSGGRAGRPAAHARRRRAAGRGCCVPIAMRDCCREM